MNRPGWVAPLAVAVLGLAAAAVVALVGGMGSGAAGQLLGQSVAVALGTGVLAALVLRATRRRGL
ncbi:MAG: hypothetical protein JWM85_1957, partial [Acidimicrobiaceae bacterium]|nr:hypothetical protein [Acidimicrobiaceae bacterium]